MNWELCWCFEEEGGRAWEKEQSTRAATEGEGLFGESDEKTNGSSAMLCCLSQQWLHMKVNYCYRRIKTLLSRTSLSANKRCSYYRIFIMFDYWKSV